MLRANADNTKQNDLLVINDLIERQHRMTAVERFSALHDRDALPSGRDRYQSLIPLTEPGEGEQYAFEVDLDACTGCKACVAACHNLNGLDETESWRDVGLLVGGTEAEPVHQHVTTACHHCVEPGCMDGCPVNAYEKNDVTGIVKHLDDQCIGCQYCMLKCPYDVPKYNAKKGIVRKCDMCSDRLSVGEAPACVQSCPNEAIKITVVKTDDALARSKPDEFLNGAPGPKYTKPTTIYKHAEPLPDNIEAADKYDLKPQHAHWSLIIMLVLTQMSVGGLLFSLMGELFKGATDGYSLSQALCVLGLGGLAIGAATLHLGRPLYAFRAFIGLRRSWLSREIVAFGGFAKVAAVYAGLMWFMPEQRLLIMGAGLTALLMGVGGVFCSAMIYHDTRRDFWRIGSTGTKFMLSMLILGSSLVLFGLSVNGVMMESAGEGSSSVQIGLGVVLILSMMLKLVMESLPLKFLMDIEYSSWKRAALLMTTIFKRLLMIRVGLVILGGFVLPLVVMGMSSGSLVVCGLTGVMLLVNLSGELIERYLFFTLVDAPKMPGGVK